MDPILSNIANTNLHAESPKNGQHDLLARLYREIGISAVAAALQVADEAPKSEPSAIERRVALLSSKAA
jgi:hypothetical protein